MKMVIYIFLFSFISCKLIILTITCPVFCKGRLPLNIFRFLFLIVQLLLCVNKLFCFPHIFLIDQ
ncbi:unnamed protein product [Aphis gossypii]|uniref:Uncharacterized protein n=1 Tax=Aphis gossypii TaxID=80765 RepID=A0A9P0J435_APHGO|nr:unnamed protein product [Aphis gossypii]